MGGLRFRPFSPEMIRGIISVTALNVSHAKHLTVRSNYEMAIKVTLG